MGELVGVRNAARRVDGAVEHGGRVVGHLGLGRREERGGPADGPQRQPEVAVREDGDRTRFEVEGGQLAVISVAISEPDLAGGCGDRSLGLTVQRPRADHRPGVEVDPGDARRRRHAHEDVTSHQAERGRTVKPADPSQHRSILGEDVDLVTDRHNHVAGRGIHHEIVGRSRPQGCPGELGPIRSGLRQVQIQGLRVVRDQRDVVERLVRRVAGGVVGAQDVRGSVSDRGELVAA